MLILGFSDSIPQASSFYPADASFETELGEYFPDPEVDLFLGMDFSGTE